MAQAQSPATHERGPRHGRVRRWVAGLAAGLAFLLLALAASTATLWWWSGREGSLHTTLHWLAAQPQLGLQAEEAQGSLRHGGRITQLSWQQPQGGLRLQARDLTLRWDLSEVLRQALATRPRIHLQALQIGLLRVEPGPSTEPPTPPGSLQLPVDLQVDEAAVGQLLWAGAVQWQAQELAGRYRYGEDQHQLTLRQARYAQGSYQGQATLQARGDMQLEAELRGRLQATLGGRRAIELQLQANASGPLQALALQAQLDSPAQPGRPQARLQARLTPWRSPLLPEAQAQFEQLDLALLWPQAPHTRLSGQAEVRPQGQRWRFTTQVRNALAGPWNQGALPLDTLDARGQWQDGTLLIEHLQASLGPGRLQAQGQWLANRGPQPGWQVQASLENLQVAQIDSRWPALQVQGQVHAEQGADRAPLRVDLNLAGKPGPQRDALTGFQRLQAQARGQWHAGLLQLDQLTLHGDQAQLQASGQLRPATRIGQGQLQLTAPGLALSLRSAWPLAQAEGELDVQALELQRTLPWLRSLPGLAPLLPPSLAKVQAKGSAGLRLSWPRGLSDAQVDATLDLPVLDLPREGGQPLALRGLKAQAQGPVGRLPWQVQARLDQQTPRLTARLSGEASLPRQALQQVLASGLQALDWQLVLAQLALDLDGGASGLWQLRNPQPLRLQGQGSRMAAEPGRLELRPVRAGATPALLQWQSLRWQGDEFASTGQWQGLPLAWAELLAGPLLSRAGLVGDLVFDGRWDLEIGERLRIQAELQRRSGDLSLHAETGQGLATRVAAGVREARLALATDGDALVLGWRWDSERAGQSDGQLRTRLERQDGRWRWPETAPLSGQLQARFPRLGLWSALAPPGWRWRGSLLTELNVAGTRSQPLLSGPLQADDLALRSVVDGIELGRGRLRARLEGERLVVQEFSLQGPGTQGGSLMASGQASWVQGEPQVRLEARLNQLRASVRRDRQLTVSGELQAQLQGPPGRTPAEVTGVLRLDQARIRLPDEERPQLDADVVVRRGGVAPTQPQPVAANTAPGLLNLAVRLDLGEDFQVEGKGLNAKLRGSLAVTGDAFTRPPRLFGTVTTASGEYRAYGQRLQIDRGLLRFSGPPDNPALDILALRPNLTQRVGVQVTGTALLPRVRLYSEPEMSEAEKLAWLVLGRSAAAGGAEAAVLQQAAIALLGSRSALNRGGLASSLGLDELSVRGASTQADGTATGGAIMFGKRLSSNFYAAYESSLSGALGTLYLFYELSQRLTVRAQTGAQTAVDLIFTLPYD